MIFLFTDYGLEGPYIGQVESVLHHHAPKAKVINLMADAPRNNPKASAYLLASLVHRKAWKRNISMAYHMEPGNIIQ